MQTIFTREALYELVWSTPVKALAGEYGISDVAFAKTCKQHFIPLPPRGHWAKLEAGKRVYRQPLPSRGLGMPRDVSFGGSRWEYYGPLPKNLTEIDLRPPPPFDETLDTLRAAIAKRIKKPTLARDLAMAHPIIRRFIEADAPRRKKYLASSYRSFYEAPYFDSPFEQRRLKLLNALFLCLEKNDARVTSSGKNPRDFSVRVGLTDVSISIDDPKVERTSWHGSDITKPASTPMIARIGPGTAVDGLPMTWEDTAREKIEAHLADVVINVLIAAENTCRQQEFSHYNWLVNRKADLIERAEKQRLEAERAERERRIKEEKARVDRLLSEARALRDADEIRSYVSLVRARNDTSRDPVPDDRLAQWATWALEQADRIDPVISRRFLLDED